MGTTERSQMSIALKPSVPSERGFGSVHESQRGDRVAEALHLFPAPAVTGVLPLLAPLGAAGLALVMIFTIVFHIAGARAAHDWSVNGLLLALAVFVAVGRFMIVPGEPRPLVA